MAGIVEVLRVLTAPGDGVVITPPVVSARSSTRSRRPGAASSRSRWPDGELDLDGLDRAFGAGARAFLLCSPHNPTGAGARPRDAGGGRRARRAARRARRVRRDPRAARAARRAATRRSRRSARRAAVVITSASKAFNTPGLKCALAIAGSRGGRARAARAAGGGPLPRGAARRDRRPRPRSSTATRGSTSCWPRSTPTAATGSARCSREHLPRDRLPAAGRELPRLAGLPRAGPGRRPRGGVPRARPRRARARARVRRAGPRLRAAQHRHLGRAARRGGAAHGRAPFAERARRRRAELAAPGRAAPRLDLRGLEQPMPPSGRSPSRSGPNATRSSAQHAMADGLAHPPHLPLAPLVQHELDAVGREPPHLGGRGLAVVERDALAQPPQRGLAHRRVADLDAVDARDLERRVGEPVGELPVVREQEQAGRVGVEPPDRVQALAARRSARRPSGGPAGPSRCSRSRRAC